MDAASFVMTAYGFFSIIGGIIGFLKAGSRASLAAGVISGLILLGCGYLSSGSASPNSIYVGTVVAMLLGGRFFKTWLAKRRLMPDAVMIFLSALTIIFNTLRLVGA